MRNLGLFGLFKTVLEEFITWENPVHPRELQKPGEEKQKMLQQYLISIVSENHYQAEEKGELKIRVNTGPRWKPAPLGFAPPELSSSSHSTRLLKRELYQAKPPS